MTDRNTALRTLLTFLILLLFPFWSFANNKIEENACYGNDKLSRLVREITDAKVEKSNRKDSGIDEAFTFGYAEADVDGNRSLLYSNQVMKFDYYASSVGASLGGTKLVNAVRLYGNSSRLDQKYMEIYLSSEGLDGSWYKAETFCIEKDELGLKVIFAEPIEAGYVKIHSTWDERDVAYSPVDCSETRGTPYDLLEVFIIQNGRRNEWSYDARGNRIDSTVDNNSLVIEYYENSDLLKKYGEWYFNYDANGNMIARGKNGTKKIAAASNELFEGYVFSSDTGELWTYEYDLSNRLVKVNYSNNGTNGLKEKTGYLYDYRGLCIAKTSGNETEYHEYTADGRLIYTERSDYVADYVYSGTSIFAEVRKQNGNDETFYHHTDHLGTTEVITDESGTVVWKASYEAFGSVLCENGTRVFEASFTGKFFDKDIGLYYFNARWYDAETGKFVTQDPARDGINWYAYCLNNPLKYFDPLGLESEEGTTNSNLWENAINDIENGFRAFVNLDFGTDWGNSAANSYKNSHYLLGTIQEINGMFEVALDFGLAYVGAAVLGAVEYGISTSTTTGSLTSGYISGKNQLTKSVDKLKNNTFNTFINMTSTISNKLNTVFNSTEKVDITNLIKNPTDPFDYDKGNYSYEALRNYREYIKENGTIPEPIRVNQLENGKYIITDGHHRWYAAKQMGLKEVPIIVE